MATHRDQFKGVMGKRQRMMAEGHVSVPDEVGAKVAILVPFLPELIQDERDYREHFEAQTAAYAAYYEARGRKPTAIMGATIEDIRGVLEDESVPNVVVAGWGSFRSVAAPFVAEADRPQDTRFAYLDWLHVANMATHVKLGQFVMLQCGGFNQKFNPPLPLGIVSSHANILGTPGLPHWAGDTMAVENLPDPITPEHHLTYDQIKELFELQLNKDFIPTRVVRAMPGAVVAARDFRNKYLNPNMPDLPDPVELERPNLTPYKQFYRPDALFGDYVKLVETA